MKTNSFFLMRAVATLIAAICLANASRAAERRARSLIEYEIEAKEANAALEAIVRENSKLQERLEETGTALAEAQKNISLAMSESEVFKRKANQLSLRLEALGLDGVGGNLSLLQQRLVTAASEVKILDDKRLQMIDALVRLSEAALTFEKTARDGDAAARTALESELKNAALALGSAAQGTVEGVPVAATLQEGMIISVKDSLALVVANIGKRQGVKVGMPFDVLRDGQVVGSVRIVDARDQISGAVIQDLISEKEPIQFRDQLRVAARPPE